MASVWLQSALWLGLALLASLISIRVAVAVALIEIVVGAVAGNLVGLQITEWVNFLAGFGAILLTFLAGTEIDPRIVRKHFWSSMSIGVVGFVAPYLGVLLYAHFVIGWPWPQSQIAGIALSTTSVAVVYAVMIETRFNNTEIGKIILAACFINDLGTVLALGVVFARYDLWLLLFGAVTAVVLVVLTRYAPWMFKSLGQRVSEPQTKFVSLILLALGGMASVAGSEAVLPAYLVGSGARPDISRRTRIAAPHAHHRILDPDPILFPQGGIAGRSARGHCVDRAHSGLSRDQDRDQVHRHPAAHPLSRIRPARGDVHDATDVDRTHLRHDLGAVRAHQQDHRPEPVYDPLTAVIASAVVPTLIAQTWFQPEFKPIADDPEALPAVEAASGEP
jgi:Sodium/hydrogen exchanger family